MATKTTHDAVRDILDKTSLRSVIEASVYLWSDKRRALIRLASQNIPLFQHIGQTKLDAKSARTMIESLDESWASFRVALITICRERAQDAANHGQDGNANTWLLLAEKIGKIDD